jgi:hypothetical protein
MPVEQIEEYRSGNGRREKEDCRSAVMQPVNGYDSSNHLCEERQEIEQI